LDTTSKVCLSRCESYSTGEIYNTLKEHFVALGITGDCFKNKKVAIKPNLVSAIEPSAAATTHPSVVEAVYELLKELGADDVILAESSGGPYTPITLAHVYKVTGMAEMAERCSLPLNTDLSFSKMSFAEGKKLKSFDVITPIVDADVIVNVCKLKTHSLTGMSGAVKNLFGVIPGTLKVEMHAAYGQLDDFSEMLADLCISLMKEKTVISVCDAIYSMEGNGPTHGNPVKTDLLFTSASPFALDIVAEHVIGADGETKYLDYGAERLGMVRAYDESAVVGDVTVKTLAKPDSKAGSLLRNLPNYFGGALARYLEPKPKVNNEKCIGCGKCMNFCPQKTIEIIKKKGKKKARIKDKNCIRCYCCQELCPSAAVDTVTSPLLRLVH